MTPELVELYVAHQERQKYLHTRLTAPLAAAAKKPDAKAIIVNALRGRTIANPDLAKAIARLLARLGAPAKPAPVAPAATAGREAALLAAIAEEPASNAPRLVYADWLLEQGDPWGACIHAACKRRGSESSTRAERRHATRFLAPIRPFLRHFDFERGLLSRVRVDARQFLKAADAIAERAPRAALELVDVAPADVPALARASLGRFASVSFERARVDDAGANALARSVTLAGVEELRLERNRMTDAGMRALASSPHLRSLRVLSLTNAKAPASVETLAFFLAFPALEQLDIECAGAGLGRAIAACKAPLESLYLDAPDLGDADIDAIARAWKRRSRFWLRLGDHDLSPRGMTVYTRLVDAFGDTVA